MKYQKSFKLIGITSSFSHQISNDKKIANR